LNLHIPAVFHFSGHGSDEGIYFETEDRARAKLLSGALLAEALAALDQPPRVAVLNACDTKITGELIAQGTVEAVVSMAQPISDTAARVFVEQFYSAIANGQSLASAFRQGRVKLTMAELNEDETPVLTCADNVDPTSVVLVEPA
jgi:CHAT domain-containing protein